jgi:tRNA modification GTPase
MEGPFFFFLRKYRYGLVVQDSRDDEDAVVPPLYITHARHRTHLESALGFLDAFLDTRGSLCRSRFSAFSSLMGLSVFCFILAPDDVVFGAEELRYAAQAVGKISGLVDVEDVLDVIFSQFCIGK